MHSPWARRRLPRWCGGRMPVQAAQWTEFLSCPICYNEFDSSGHQPISLGCSHTVCKTCLHKLHRKACPFDQTPISTDIDLLPVNCALLQLVGAQVSRVWVKTFYVSVSSVCSRCASLRSQTCNRWAWAVQQKLRTMRCAGCVWKSWLSTWNLSAEQKVCLFLCFWWKI